MDDGSRSRFIHRVMDKSFDTIFTKKGSSTDEKYRKALKTLGISDIVNYTSCEDNIAKLQKTGTTLLRQKGTLSQLLRGPYSGSVVVDVPPMGDCWLIAILAQILGFIVEDEKDQKKIIPTVRRRMSEIVTKEPQRFLHLFGDNQTELEDWTRKIRKWSLESSQEKWGGSTEFEIFAQITGICVHVINKENQDFEPTVQHFVPRTFLE